MMPDTGCYGIRIDPEQVSISGEYRDDDGDGTRIRCYNTWPTGFRPVASTMAATKRLFGGGVFDGKRSIWLTPMDVQVIARIDIVTGALIVLTGNAGFPSGYQHRAVSGEFGGVLSDGNGGVYLTPYMGTSLVRVDIEETTSSTAVEVAMSKSYVGGAYDGRNFWLTPLDGTTGIARVRCGLPQAQCDQLYVEACPTMTKPRAPLLGKNCHSRFSSSDGVGSSVPFRENQTLYSISSQPRLTAFPLNFHSVENAYSGACFDNNGSVWAVPHKAVAVLRINTSDGSTTQFNQWPKGFNVEGVKFKGGAFVVLPKTKDLTTEEEGFLWLFPRDAFPFVRLRVRDGTMESFSKFPSGFNYVANAFLGGVYDQHGSVWMVPFVPKPLLRLNVVDGSMIAYPEWRFASVQMTQLFGGGCHEHESFSEEEGAVWLAPQKATAVIRIRVRDGSTMAFDDFPFTNKAEYYFRGIAFDGTYIWMAPTGDSKLVFLRLTRETGAMASITVGPTALDLFSLTFTGGGEIWGTPYGVEVFARLDTEPSSTGGGIGSARYYGDAAVDTYWPSALPAPRSFSGAAFDGESLWFVPWTASMIVKLSCGLPKGLCREKFALPSCSSLEAALRLATPSSTSMASEPPAFPTPTPTVALPSNSSENSTPSPPMSSSSSNGSITTLIPTLPSQSTSSPVADHLSTKTKTIRQGTSAPSGLPPIPHTITKTELQSESSRNASSSSNAVVGASVEDLLVSSNVVGSAAAAKGLIVTGAASSGAIGVLNPSAASKANNLGRLVSVAACNALADDAEEVLDPPWHQFLAVPLGSDPTGKTRGAMLFTTFVVLLMGGLCAWFSGSSPSSSATTAPPRMTRQRIVSALFATSFVFFGPNVVNLSASFLFQTSIQKPFIDTLIAVIALVTMALILVSSAYIIGFKYSVVRKELKATKKSSSDGSNSSLIGGDQPLIEPATATATVSTSPSLMQRFFAIGFVGWYDMARDEQQRSVRILVVEDAAVAIGFAFLAAIPAATRGACTVIALLVVGLSVAHVGYIVALRPYAIFAELLFAGVIAATQAIISICATVLVFQQQQEEAAAADGGTLSVVKVLGWLVLFMNVVFYVQLVVLVLLEVVHSYKKWKGRQSLEKNVRQPEGDTPSGPLLLDHPHDPSDSGGRHHALVVPLLVEPATGSKDNGDLKVNQTANPLLQKP